MQDEKTGRFVQVDYKPDDVVQVVNPTDEDFDFQVGESIVTDDGKSRTQAHKQKSYLVKAGDRINIPGFVADLYIKKMVDKMMQDDGKVLNMSVPESRLEYENNLFVGVVDIYDPENKVGKIPQGVGEALASQPADNPPSGNYDVTSAIPSAPEASASTPANSDAFSSAEDVAQKAEEVEESSSDLKPGLKKLTPTPQKKVEPKVV